MSILTIQLPEDKHDRFRALAQSEEISVNRLVDELATVALANHDVRPDRDVPSLPGASRGAT